MWLHGGVLHCVGWAGAGAGTGEWNEEFLPSPDLATTSQQQQEDVNIQDRQLDGSAGPHLYQDVRSGDWLLTSHQHCVEMAGSCGTMETGDHLFALGVNPINNISVQWDSTIKQ